MILARTHTLAKNGRCADCGDRLCSDAHYDKNLLAPFTVGQRVGKITTTHGGTVVYPIGQHDSNQRCT